MSIAEHPDYPKLEARIQSLADARAAIDEHLFRMVNPRYCSDNDIISGEGGRRASGRWNLRGEFRCTYAARTPETALQESLSAVRRKNLPDEEALPRTLVCISAKLGKVLDLTDGKIRQRLRVSRDRMIDAKQWRSDNYHNRESLTQAIGRAAFAAGLEALIAPSAADQSDGVVVLIFPENLLSTSALSVITPIRP